MKLQYKVGDCLEFDDLSKCRYVVPHVCNDIGGWGSGFVVAVSKKYELPEKKYRQWYLGDDIYGDGPFELGNVQFVKAESSVCIANMIAQHSIITKTKKPIRYRHLSNALVKVGEFCRISQQKINDKLLERGLEENVITVKIQCPMFGSGLAGGNWDFIEELINEIWVGEYGIGVTVCALTKEDLPHGI